MAGPSENAPLYRHRQDLFTVGGKPMKFRMRPCSERRKIKGLIEHGGGTVTSIYSEGCTRLAPPGSILTTDETVSTEFIMQCVAANKLLDSEKFMLPKLKRVEQKDSFDQIPSPSKAKAEHKITKFYTKEDDTAILKYIERHNKFHAVKGNVIWQEMQHKKVTNHTWQSMKNRLLRNIAPQLENYHSISENFKKCLAEQLNIRYSVNRNGNLNTQRVIQNKNTPNSKFSGLTVSLERLQSVSPTVVVESKQNHTESTATADHELSNDLLKRHSQKRFTRNTILSTTKDDQEIQETENIRELRSRRAVTPSNKALLDKNTGSQSALTPTARFELRLDVRKPCVTVSEGSTIKRQTKTRLQKNQKLKDDQENSFFETLSDSSESWSKIPDNLDSSSSSCSIGKPSTKRRRLVRVPHSNSALCTQDDIQRRVTRSRIRQDHKRSIISTPLKKPLGKVCEDLNSQGLLEDDKNNLLKTIGARKKDKLNKTGKSEVKRKLRSAKNRQNEAWNEECVSEADISDTEIGASSDQEANATCSRKVIEGTDSPLQRKPMDRKLSNSDSDVSNASTVVSPYNQACCVGPPCNGNHHHANNGSSSVTDFTNNSDCTSTVADYGDNDDSDSCKMPVVKGEHISNVRVHRQHLRKLANIERGATARPILLDDSVHLSLPSTCSNSTNATVDDYPSSLEKDPSVKRLKMLLSMMDDSSELNSSPGYDTCKSKTVETLAEDTVETPLLQNVQTLESMVLNAATDKCNAPKSDKFDILLSTDVSEELESPLEIIGPSSSSDPGQVEVAEERNNVIDQDLQNDNDIKLKTRPPFNELEVRNTVTSSDVSTEKSPQKFDANYLSKYFSKAEILVAQEKNFTLSNAFEYMEDLLVERCVNQKFVPSSTKVIADVCDKSSVSSKATVNVHESCDVHRRTLEKGCGASYSTITEAELDHAVQTVLCDKSIQTDVYPCVSMDHAVQTDIYHKSIQTEVFSCVVENSSAQTDDFCKSIDVGQTITIEPDSCHESAEVTQAFAIQLDNYHESAEVSEVCAIQPEDCPKSAEVGQDDATQLEDCHKSSEVSQTGVCHPDDCYKLTEAGQTCVIPPQRCHKSDEEGQVCVIPPQDGHKSPEDRPDFLIPPENCHNSPEDDEACALQLENYKLVEVSQTCAIHHDGCYKLTEVGQAHAVPFEDFHETVEVRQSCAADSDDSHKMTALSQMHPIHIDDDDHKCVTAEESCAVQPDSVEASSAIIENAIKEVALMTAPNINSSLIICEWLSKCLDIPVQDLQKFLNTYIANEGQSVVKTESS